MEYECPSCGEWLEIGEFQVQGDCIECQEPFIVDRDAEFVDGMWRDRTKLLSRSLPPVQEHLLLEDHPTLLIPSPRKHDSTEDLEYETGFQRVKRIMEEANE